MEIVNVRIDGRLIHGQVATMWNGTLKPSRIMVVDDKIIHDDMQKSMLKMATPAGVKLSILNAETAANNLKIEKYGDDRIFMIARGPEALVKLFDLGVKLEEITIGNMSAGNDTIQVRKSINITSEDKKNFEYLNSKGVRLVAQMIPSDKKDNLMDLIK